MAVVCCSERYHVATWFGNCSYRRLKVTYEVRKQICPICQHDLEPIVYSGGLVIVHNRESRDYVRDMFSSMVEDGVNVWASKGKCNCVSGDYGA